MSGSEVTELQAYLESRTGPAGCIRPCHPASCPAWQAWVPLAQCRCPLALTGARRD
jgi:hypothetical protein